VRQIFPPGCCGSSVLYPSRWQILVAGGAFPLFTFLGDFELVRYNPMDQLTLSLATAGIVTTSFRVKDAMPSPWLQSDARLFAAGTDFVIFPVRIV